LNNEGICQGQHDTSAYVSFPGSVAAFGMNDFTVSFWYKTSFAVANHLGDVMGNRTAAAYGNSFSIRLKGDGKLTVELSQDAAGAQYAYLDSGIVKVNDNRWHHIAVTRSLGFVRLYVDGAPLDHQFVGAASLSGTQP
jgi:Concanavalin A-like lectin/glucanases superfamily